MAFSDYQFFTGAISNFENLLVLGGKTSPRLAISESKKTFMTSLFTYSIQNGVFNFVGQQTLKNVDDPIYQLKFCKLGQDKQEYLIASTRINSLYLLKWNIFKKSWLTINKVNNIHSMRNLLT